MSRCAEIVASTKERPGRSNVSPSADAAAAQHTKPLNTATILPTAFRFLISIFLVHCLSIDPSSTRLLPWKGEKYHNAEMLLSCVSYLDCFIFLVLLAPQLILQAGLFTTLFYGFRSLPFLGPDKN